jgi:hypothetical protein
MHRAPAACDTTESELFWWGFNFFGHHQEHQLWASLDALFDLHLQRSILDMRSDWIDELVTS